VQREAAKEVMEARPDQPSPRASADMSSSSSAASASSAASTSFAVGASDSLPIWRARTIPCRASALPSKERGDSGNVPQPLVGVMTRWGNVAAVTLLRRCNTLLKTAGHSKSRRVAADFKGLIRTKRNTLVAWRFIERSAARYTIHTDLRSPSRTVSGCPNITMRKTMIPTIFSQLPHIAEHVVQAKFIWSKFSDGSSIGISIGTIKMITQTRLQLRFRQE